jgi:hypothetical protein
MDYYIEVCLFVKRPGVNEWALDVRFPAGNMVAEQRGNYEKVRGRARKA